MAIEAGRVYAANLLAHADRVAVLNIERDALPVPDGSVDLIIANQILEHTKEIFWIFHEVSRSLRIGGHFLFGVPNVASLHNRILLMFGVQPTQCKLCSAHVRPFSKDDTLKFLEACFPESFELVAFAGSQFYPFPAKVARVLGGLLPTWSYSIFFMIRKAREYRGEFATYPARAKFETNYWSGGIGADSQYT
jgi:SAM-dependent methyltransferase